MNCNTPGLPVHHHLPQFTPTSTNWLGTDCVHHLVFSIIQHGPEGQLDGIPDEPGPITFIHFLWTPIPQSPQLRKSMTNIWLRSLMLVSSQPTRWLSVTHYGKYMACFMLYRGNMVPKEISMAIATNKTSSPSSLWIGIWIDIGSISYQPSLSSIREICSRSRRPCASWATTLSSQRPRSTWSIIFILCTLSKSLCTNPWGKSWNTGSCLGPRRN